MVVMVLEPDHRPIAVAADVHASARHIQGDVDRGEFWDVAVVLHLYSGRSKLLRGDGIGFGHPDDLEKILLFFSADDLDRHAFPEIGLVVVDRVLLFSEDLLQGLLKLERFCLGAQEDRVGELQLVFDDLTVQDDAPEVRRENRRRLRQARLDHAAQVIGTLGGQASREDDGFVERDLVKRFLAVDVAGVDDELAEDVVASVGIVDVHLVDAGGDGERVVREVLRWIGAKLGELALEDIQELIQKFCRRGGAAPVIPERAEDQGAHVDGCTGLYLPLFYVIGVVFERPLHRDQHLDDLIGQRLQMEDGRDLLSRLRCP